MAFGAQILSAKGVTRPCAMAWPSCDGIMIVYNRVVVVVEHAYFQCVLLPFVGPVGLALTLALRASAGD